MNSRKEQKKYIQKILIGLILFISSSCLPSSLISTTDPTKSASTPTNTISVPTDSPEPSVPESPSDYPTPTQFENTPSEESLNDSGPWLLIESTQGLWAANPDGSGLRQLTNVDYWLGELKQAIQPGGDLIAFLTRGDYDFHHMALNLLSLPDGKITKITNLTSDLTEEYAEGSPGDPGFEALRAIGERTSYAWSPDGSRLAFSGVMDGPSADIYLYEVQTGEISRVSQNPEQDFAPSWSPNGNSLLYLAANSFGTGAGWDMSGVWAAKGDGTNPTQLFGSDSAGEEIEGWLDSTTVLIASWDQPCGLQKLRLFDLNTKQASMLYFDCFNSATADGYFGAALYSTSSGVYRVTAEDRTPTQVSTGGDAIIERRYAEDQVFMVRFTSGGLATFGTISDYDHQVSPVQANPNEMDVAVYGAIWGWTSYNEAQPGVWITGPGVDIGRIYDGPAILPIWSRDNNLLFFAVKDSGYDIYMTTFDRFYSDLERVNFFKDEPTCVAWLNGN